MKIKQAQFIFLLVCILSLNICANGLPLVVDGVSNAVIILGKNPSQASIKGARMFSEHLMQIAEVQLDTFYDNELGEVFIQDENIYTEKYGAPFCFILVGESSLTNKLNISASHLGAGGILLQTKGNALILMGPDEKTPTDPNGTQYAVSTFLQDYLGVFYLWPGELGKVVPKNNTITIPRINKNYTPPVQHRKIRFYTGTNDATMKKGITSLGYTNNDYLRVFREAASTVSFDDGWASWNRLGGDLDLKSSHAFGSLHEKYWNEHPEWFALQPDGTRIQGEPKRARLCKSNMGLIQQLAKDKIQEIKNNPRQKSVSISPNDGSLKNKFCECANCKALDSPEREDSITDRVIWFANQIAALITKEYPDILIVIDAYSKYTYAPLKNSVHPNLVIRYVGLSRWYDFDDPYGQKSVDIWDDWGKLSTNLFWRPNLLFYARDEGTLGVYVRNLALTFRKFHQSGIMALDFDAPFYDNAVGHWSTQGLSYYILSRLSWEPDLDVEEAINEYCKAGFGNGWEYIKQYFDRVEELGIQNFERFPQHYSLIYDDQIINELDGLLDSACFEAKKGTNYDESIGKRIEFLRLGLNWTSLEGRIYRKLVKILSSEPYDQAELMRLVNSRIKMMRDIFEDSPLAVNVSYVYGRVGNVF